MSITLAQFAERTGYHFTTASRLRSGDRLPSRAMLATIAKEFDLSDEQVGQWLEAIRSGGAEASGAWVRTHVFGEA